jgi:transposase
VVQGPDPTIHKVTRWRCADLRDEVARRFEVSVHESTIGKWLHQLGLSRVQPRPHHPQKDPDAETAFKKTSQPC